MAFRPLFSVPQFKALAISAAAFVAMYAFANWALPNMTPALGVPAFLSGFLISGALVGYLAKRSPLMHGSILGALTGVLAIVYVAGRDGFLKDLGLLLASAGPALLFMAVPGIVLCSLGAVLGDYFQARVRGI